MLVLSGLQFGWSDLGTWGSVHQNTGKDEHGNSIKGTVELYEAKDNVVRTVRKDKLIVMEGLEGFIVIDTEDALLICRKENEQFIKQIVGDMKTRFGEKYV